MSKSRISCEIDLTKSGRRCGFLRLRHSTDESAYGWIPIPIVCIAHGSGPTVLLVSGNHGDEYEGQITLMRLVRELPPEAVQGRLIILPAANLPAVRAGRRVSPLDRGNLNRTFPGDPDGSPTQAIAYHIEHELIPMADFVLDLHSGGSSLDYLPSAQVTRAAEEIEMQRRLTYLNVFGAPIGFVVDAPQGENRTLGGGAARAGVDYLGTELGGGGRVTPASVRVAYEGVAHILHWVGALDHALIAPAGGTRVLAVRGQDYFVYAPENGVFEPAVELGDHVEAGQVAGSIHFPETPWREPATTRFERAGTVLCRRVPSNTSRGDCLFHLGVPFEDAE